MAGCRSFLSLLSVALLGGSPLPAGGEAAAGLSCDAQKSSRGLSQKVAEFPTMLRKAPPCWCEGQKYAKLAHRRELAAKCGDPMEGALKFSNGSWLGPSLQELIWQPLTPGEGPFHRFDAACFCESLPFQGDILLVGDSTTGEMYDSLSEFLDAQLIEKTANTRTSLACNNKTVMKYVRSDTLDLSLEGFASAVWKGQYQTLCTHTQPKGVFTFMCGYWAFPEALAKTALLVMNSGLHVRACDRFAAQLDGVIRHVRKHLHPQARAFYRNTVPGYDDCVTVMNTNPAPHATLEDAEKYFWEHPWGDSNIVVSINWVAETLFRRAGWSIIDAYSPGVMRKERRGTELGALDCLHHGTTRNTGRRPVDHWNELLYNALLA